MTILECHGIFASWTDDERGDFLPGRYEVEFRPGEWCDAWPAAAVGAICLTGWLPNLQPSELPDALRQFRALFNSGILDPTEWEAETRSVIATVLAAGGDLEADLAAGDPQYN